MTDHPGLSEQRALIERLRDLLAKATPGPWAYDTSEPDPMFTPNWSIYPVADCEYSIAEVNGQVKKSAAEAQLIVEAVNALPTLLAAFAQSGVDREAVARIIDPDLWAQRDADLLRRDAWETDIKPGWGDLTFEQWAKRGTSYSLDKAGAILALTNSGTLVSGDAGLVELIARAVMVWGRPHFKHMVAFSTLCEAIEAALAAHAAPAPSDEAALPDDVVRLVTAARMVAWEDPDPENLKELQAASELFADRVPWDDQPEDEA